MSQDSPVSEETIVIVEFRLVLELREQVSGEIDFSVGFVEVCLHWYTRVLFHDCTQLTQESLVAGYCEPGRDDRCHETGVSI